MWVPGFKSLFCLLAHSTVFSPLIGNENSTCKVLWGWNESLQASTLQCWLAHSECLMKATKINKIPYSSILSPKPKKSLSPANYHLFIPVHLKGWEQRDGLCFMDQRNGAAAKRLNPCPTNQQRKSVREKVMQKVLISKRVFIEVFRGTEIQV